MVAFVSSGCHSRTGPDGSLTTYTISGTVRSNLDQSPLAGATIQATGMGANAVITQRSAVSDSAGHYAISGLRENVTVTSTKAGFFDVSADVQVTQNTEVNLAMTRSVVEEGDLVLNKTISGFIESTDEKCDPDWDANAPCRRFKFSSETSRFYQFTVTFDGLSCQLELDVARGGVPVSRNFGTARGTLAASVPLSVGVYEIRLLAFYDCRVFNLTVR